MGPLSFEELYEEYFAFAWRTAHRLGVPPEQVDDAVQDIFLVVHRRLGEFEGRASPKTWLFAITRRVVSDYRRRAKRAPHELPKHLADRTAGPLESLERAEATRLLLAILDRLDDEKREVFVLAELEQMTVPAIAEALETNVNTVYSRLRAARASFDTQLSRLRARESK